LYGKSSNVATTTETSFRPLPGRATTPRVTFDEGGSRGNIELCESDGKIDTMFTGPDNKAYVFKGLEMNSRYLLTNSRVSPFYLNFVCVFLFVKQKQNIPNNDDDDIILRKTGEKYWKLESEAVAPGYPRSIRADWEGLPGNIDAAFTWTNGRTYFFKVYFITFANKFIDLYVNSATAYQLIMK
jgi:matrix metalloproteinase-14 (membrane-inserted)